MSAALVAVLLAAAPALGASRYWVGGSGAWGDSAHWASVSAGGGGASVPGSGDDAIFDGASGSSTVSLSGNPAVRDLIVTGAASSGLTLAFGSARLTCSRDCLLLSGRVDQGAEGQSRLVVGRNLDTADAQLSWSEEYSLTIELTGTGTWRYSLADGRQPLLWDLHAAANGQTTTLRPVGNVPIGVDIDVHNQLTLGNGTSLLDLDLAEAISSNPVTIEIHSRSDTVDIQSNGARIAIDAIEHEMHGPGPGQLQANVVFDGLTIYDVTGLHNASPGNGKTWQMMGDLDLGNAQLRIEKTSVLDTAGLELHVGSIQVGGGSSGTGELHVGTGEVRVAQRLRVGGGGGRYGRVQLGDGLVVANYLEGRSPGGFVQGSDGTLELTGSASGGSSVYVSSSIGNDSNPGTESSPYRTFGRAESALGSGTTVRFRRGDSWDLGSGAAINASGGALGAYGSGDRPVLRLAEGARLDIAGAWTAHDLRIEFGSGSVDPGGDPPAAPVLLGD